MCIVRGRWPIWYIYFCPMVIQIRSKMIILQSFLHCKLKFLILFSAAHFFYTHSAVNLILVNSFCLTINFLFSRLETDARRKKEEHWRKKVSSCCEFFSVTRIRLIWLDIFVEPANSEEKKSLWLDESAYFRTSESWRKKDKTVSFLSNSTDSMV